MVIVLYYHSTKTPKHNWNVVQLVSITTVDPRPGTRHVGKQSPPSELICRPDLQYKEQKQHEYGEIVILEMREGKLQRLEVWQG